MQCEKSSWFVIEIKSEERLVSTSVCHRIFKLTTKDLTFSQSSNVFVWFFIHPLSVHKAFKSFIFFYQPLSVRGWTSAFLLDFHRLCGAIEGRLSHFLPHWLRTGWQSMTSQGIIPWNTPPWLGIEPGPRGGQTVSYIHSPTELSWLTAMLWTEKLTICCWPKDDKFRRG